MIFMAQGVSRFSGDRRNAIHSFVWPALVFPLTLFGFSFHDTGLPMAVFLGLHAVRMLLALALSLALIYVFASYFDRARHYWRYVTASNWMNIPLSLLLLPMLLGLASIAGDAEVSGQYKALVETFGSYAVFMTIAGYVYTAFVMTHALSVPWQLAGAVTIVCLGIDQTLMGVMRMLSPYIGA